MSPSDISAWINASFDDVVSKASWGETAFFVNPGLTLPSGAYFATLKEKDGDNDKASALHRPGVFRLNIGAGPKAFEALFGRRPARPAKGGIIQGNWDFTALDHITPHPVYGWMGWIAVLNPSSATMETVFPLIRTAYVRARATVDKRLKN